VNLIIPNSLCNKFDIVKEEPRLLKEIEEWCSENLKKPWHVFRGAADFSPWEITIGDQTILVNVRKFEAEIAFEDDSDAVFFKMRWF
jgi:hypothetical protein